jgi:hypothetical protein
MDVRRIGQGAKIAAGAAVVLLIVMFLSWFQLDGVTAEATGLPEGAPSSFEISGSDLEDEAESAGESTSRNAWQSFGLIDIVLLVTIIAAIAMALIQASGNSARAPGWLTTAVAGLGFLAAVLVLFRLISPPDLIDAFGGTSDIPDNVDIDTDVGRQFGVFLGLIAAAGIAYGGWRATQEEGAQGAVSPPPPPPPPAAPPSAGPPPAQ